MESTHQKVHALWRLQAIHEDIGRDVPCIAYLEDEHATRWLLTPETDSQKAACYETTYEMPVVTPDLILPAKRRTKR